MKFLFAALFLCLGVLFWLFWHGTVKDVSDVSVGLDNAISDILVEHGMGDTAVASISRRQKRSARVSWIEYNRVMKLPGSVDAEKLAGRIRKIAKDRSLTLRSVPGRADAVTLEVSSGKMLLYRLTLLLPQGTQGTQETKPAAGKKSVAIVIDDLGYQNDISQFLDLGIPITFAVLPYERHTKNIEAQLTALKMPYILHLPMEPFSYPKENPGKAALYVKMGKDEIRDKFLSDISSVQRAAGVSNHMGSRFTADREKMGFLLEAMKEKGMFYFDSYTSSMTQAGRAAKDVGVPCLSNELFLDLKDDPVYMGKQCERLIRMANRYGKAIAIGHIHKKHMAATLAEYIPRFKEAGIEFVYLTDMLENKQDRSETRNPK